MFVGSNRLPVLPRTHQDMDFVFVHFVVRRVNCVSLTKIYQVEVFI